MEIRSPSSNDAAAACPVDPQTRDRWLAAAKARNAQPPSHPPTIPLTDPIPRAAAAPVPGGARATNGGNDTLHNYQMDLMLPEQQNKGRSLKARQEKDNLMHPAGVQGQNGRFPAGMSPNSARFSLDTSTWVPIIPSRSRPQRPSPAEVSLSTHRETSSIPRAPTSGPLNAAERAALPSPNNETSNPTTDNDTGNWIYPSQQMFFQAMRRKSHPADPADMATIVPIHNAVNERAWAEIKAWEAPHNPISNTCDGPKLVSFSGDSKALTPKAWMRGLMGYTAPFDRHDWVVERCDRKRVEYVIDFYQGKVEEGKEKSLGFYLDVRPKLNTWEGMTMRVGKWIGLG